MRIQFTRNNTLNDYFSRKLSTQIYQTLFETLIFVSQY